MNEIPSSSQERVSYAAYGAALLFAIHLVTYFIPTIRDVTTSSSAIGAEALALLAVAEHLILFPVVAALPVPQWARAVGYGWLVLISRRISCNSMLLSNSPISRCVMGPTLLLLSM